MAEKETRLHELEFCRLQAVIRDEEVGARVEERPAHGVDRTPGERDIRKLDGVILRAEIILDTEVARRRNFPHRVRQLAIDENGAQLALGFHALEIRLQPQT